MTLIQQARWNLGEMGGGGEGQGVNCPLPPPPRVGQIPKHIIWRCYSTNDDLVKMEFISKINIFSLKMTVKNGLEMFILKSLHAEFFFTVTEFLILGKNISFYVWVL